MTPFRLFLCVCLIAIGAYTSVTIARHGMGLLPIFFGDIATFTWRGQFNLDFLAMLTLSGLWVAWRGGFSPLSLALGLVAFFGGAPFLCLYLLLAGAKRPGDVAALLLGPSRADALRGTYGT